MALIEMSRKHPQTYYRPVATVHDAILAYAKKPKTALVAKVTREVMQHPELLDKFEIELQIPIEAEVTIGPWGKGVKFKEAA
jgi:DNA polymerase I-like protein with 3'-5' exonuclease and polymerase domains